MPKSLRESTQQPNYTKGVIQSSIRSRNGSLRIWCVVEASDDVVVYRKFFNTDVELLPSVDEKGRCSCHNVEEIVTSLYEEKEDIRLFGIRDRDYTRYDSSYNCPQNIFLTDYRDVEMMMFHSESVIEELKKWNRTFPKKIELCATVVRYIGYLRIYNDVKNISCKFKNFLKSSLVWNETSHTVVTGFKQNLFNKFKATCHHNQSNGMNVTEDDFNSFVTEHNLEAEPYENTCRGHDMLWLLPLIMIKTSEFNTESITIRMVDAYSMEAFAETQLYCDIRAWSERRGINVLIQ